MTAISTAISSDRLSRASAYKLLKGFFSNDTPNLPQQIVVLAQANTANQATLALNDDGTPTPIVVTSADDAGKKFGYGSPIHQIMRILRPLSGEGVGGIPTIAMAQKEAVGATATAIVWTITGNVTKNKTHYIAINGRKSLDTKFYAIDLVTGDTPTVVAGKYVAAINGILGAPVIASNAAGVITLTTKWKGATSAELQTRIDINGDSAGLTYALTSTTPGAGTADISGALALFQDNWYTTIINSYGTATLDALEQVNGVPDVLNPTGRYAGMVFKPFMAFFGSVLSTVAGLTAITNADARINQVTNVLCPAPNSEGFTWEAAANVVSLFAPSAQNTPQLDVGGQNYPDMPIPANNSAGDMGTYNNRDLLMKAGCSTVALVKGVYQIQDLVTTYHTIGETPLQYNFPRNLNIDWNIKDAYGILETRFVKDHVIVLDNQITNVLNAIKPREWVSILFDLFDILAEAALISDPAFSKASVQVQIDTDNPNRFNTTFRYKRTGIAHIESTDVTAGF